MGVGLRTVLVLLGAAVVASAIDCRKFAFAPACRGVMVKRGGEDSAVPAALHQLREDIAQLTAEVGRLRRVQSEDCAALNGLLQGQA